MTDVKINGIWMTENYIESPSGKKLSQLFKEKNIAIKMASEKSIQRVSDSQNSQGIIAIMQQPKYKELQDIHRYSLYLEDIADPGNMGTILRTAAWFGIDSVFFSSGCVDIFNSKVMRSGMGAHFYFKQLQSVSPDEILSKCENSHIPIFGADIHGESLDKLTIHTENGWILILGNEAHGISSSIQQYLTHRIAILGSGSMESLNVAVAGGIILQYLTRS